MRIYAGSALAPIARWKVMDIRFCLYQFFSIPLGWYCLFHLYTHFILLQSSNFYRLLLLLSKLLFGTSTIKNLFWFKLIIKLLYWTLWLLIFLYCIIRNFKSHFSETSLLLLLAAGNWMLVINYLSSNFPFSWLPGFPVWRQVAFYSNTP